MIKFIPCSCRKTAIRRCPWARYLGKTSGGFMAFENRKDYEAWKVVYYMGRG